jgi:invasion protein IalB
MTGVRKLLAICTTALALAAGAAAPALADNHPPASEMDSPHDAWPMDSGAG